MKRLKNMKQLMKGLAPLFLALLITVSAHAATQLRKVVKRHQTIIYYPTADQSHVQPKAPPSKSPPVVEMVPLPPRDTTNTTPLNHQPRPRRPMTVSGTVLPPPPHTVITHPYRQPPGVLPPVVERVSDPPARHRVSSYSHYRTAHRYYGTARRRPVRRISSRRYRSAHHSTQTRGLHS